MFKGHLKAPSPIYDHHNITGHLTTVNNFSIMGRKDWNCNRTITESVYVRINGSSIYKNIGKYYLPHIWDAFLLNTPELMKGQTLYKPIAMPYATTLAYHLPYYFMLCITSQSTVELSQQW